MKKTLPMAMAAVIVATLTATSPAVANQWPAFDKPTPSTRVYQEATATQPKITVVVNADGKRDVLIQPLSGGTVFNCQNNWVCIFDGTNYGTFHWAHSDIDLLMGTCQNVAFMTTLGTGGSMNNGTSSVIVNPDSKFSGSSANVTFWPNDGCAGTPRPYHVFGDGLGLDPDLTNGGFHIASNWSNTLTSIRYTSS